MIKNQYNDKINLNYLIILSILIHLISINFHPTNFEGGYGQYSDLFNEDNKILYLKSYYSSQFNTYAFSALGSLLNFFVPFVDGFQSIKILSTMSYIFLGLGLFNILIFYGFKFKPITFISIIFFNCIIFSYGFRAFNDLFAFSLGIFAFSRILSFQKNKLLWFDSLLLGVSMVIKSYNLILLIPLVIFFYSRINLFKINKIIISIVIILLPIIFFNIFTYNTLGFVLAPSNEDLEIAIIGNDKNRDFFWVINNFIFYIGYLTLICFPFIIISLISYIKKQTKKILYSLLILFFLSFYIQKYFFIASELDLGPVQNYINEKFYKTVIIFLFFLFVYYVYFFFKFERLNKKQFNICITIIISVLIYLFVLSFIKAAQRYLILPLPFLYLLIFNKQQPQILILVTLFIYMIINSLLLGNYYIVGKSTKIIMDYLKINQIVENTIPGVITPHVYHLNNKKNILNEKKLTSDSSRYRITYFNENSIFSSRINFLGYEIKKYSVVKIK
tara:strand:+ start:6995 stop:8503 length:1509 start_codon:yes stop_codon:yes gene_type:complete